MIVLKEGNLHENWSTAADCPICEAALEVTERDLIMSYTGDYYSTGFPVVKCPTCQEVIRVDNVPKIVVKRAKKHNSIRTVAW
jgi:hypothetical protein